MSTETVPYFKALDHAIYIAEHVGRETKDFSLGVAAGTEAFDGWKAESPTNLCPVMVRGTYTAIRAAAFLGKTAREPIAIQEQPRKSAAPVVDTRGSEKAKPEPEEKPKDHGTDKGFKMPW